MYIVFCQAVSSMGKKFEDNEEGHKEMGIYIAECLALYPTSSVKVERYI